jgi:starvation-inducible DNA-binding protein
MDAVNSKDRKLVDDLVIQVLRDSMFVLETTRLVHWGLNGSKFYQVHLLTGDIQDEMHAGVDTIAEHARSINIMTPLSVNNLFSTRMQEIDMSNPYDEDKIILELSVVHDMLASLFEELAKYAGMIGDDLTQDMAADRGREHKKHQWHLRSTLTYKYETEEDVKQNEESKS